MLLNQTPKSIFITARGLTKIEAELAFLRQVKRPEIIDRLQDARSGGDSIDNTEYISVEDELAFVDGRIFELDHILRYAELIEPCASADGIVRMGSTVMVQESGGDIETYTLVGPAEADPCEGLISNESPLGRALLNHCVGDVVDVKAPEGMKRFHILSAQ